MTKILSQVGGGGYLGNKNQSTNSEAQSEWGLGNRGLEATERGI